MKNSRMVEFSYQKQPKKEIIKMLVSAARMKHEEEKKMKAWKTE